MSPEEVGRAVERAMVALGVAMMLVDTAGRALALILTGRWSAGMPWLTAVASSLLVAYFVHRWLRRKASETRGQRR